MKTFLACLRYPALLIVCGVSLLVWACNVVETTDETHINLKLDDSLTVEYGVYDTLQIDILDSTGSLLIEKAFRGEFKREGVAGSESRIRNIYLGEDPPKKYTIRVRAFIGDREAVKMEISVTPTAVEKPVITHPIDTGHTLIKPTKLSLVTPGPLVIALGSLAVQAEAGVLPAEADPALQWIIRDTLVAKVDSLGKVSPVGLGFTRLVAMSKRDISVRDSLIVQVVTPQGEAPVVVITKPSTPDTLVKTATFTVEYSADNAPKTKVVTLKEGLNVVVVTESGAGGTGSDTVRITLDSEAPDVKIASPVQGHITNSSTIAVGWTVDGIEQTKAKTENLAGKQGAIQIIREAADAAGNAGSDTVVITRDTVAPLAPVFDLNASATTASPTNLSNPKWTWKAAASSGGNGTFRYQFGSQDPVEGTATSFTAAGLADGEHSLSVQERDVAGNWSAASVHKITVKVTKPGKPQVAGPSGPVKDPVWTWSAGVNSGGNGSFRWKLNDGNYSAETKTKTYALPATGFPDGTYTLAVQERDAAGNWSDEAKMSVTLDRTAPVVKIISPADGFVTNKDQLIVTYSVENGGSITSDQYSAILSHNDGIPNSITIASEADAAGNIGIKTIVVYRYSKVVFVRKGSKSGGDGSSWDDAYPELSIPLDTTRRLPPGTQIWISTGTYNTGAYEKFYLQATIGIYGGFAGTGYPHGLGSRTGSHPTTLIGEGIRGNKQSDDYVNNVIIDGLTLSDSRFGLVLNDDIINIQVKNCVFKNFGKNGKSGTIPVYLLGGSGTFIDCQFIDNEELEYAAVQAYGGNYTFENCQFINNKGGNFSGGLHLWSGVHIVRNCHFSGNSALNPISPTSAQEISVWGGTLDIAGSEVEGGKDGVIKLESENAILIWGAGNTEP